MSDNRTRPVVQLRVSLMHIEPEIWRRIQVSSDITLAGLHRVIRIVMGWDGDHAHEFIVGERRYGIPPENPPLLAPPRKDEKGARLRQITSNEGDTFCYEYDFGDSWRHELQVEEILRPEEAEQTPICLNGEMAGPPEDCGGVYGYARIQEYFEDPDSVELREPLSMMVKGYDPEAFDIEEVNRRLKFLRE